MKIFNDNEFACPKHSSVGGVDGNGQQYLTICLKCRLDDRDICNGDILGCENNHKKNSYSVFLTQGSRYIKNIKRGKDETLSLPELKKIAEEYLKREIIL